MTVRASISFVPRLLPSPMAVAYRAATMKEAGAGADARAAWLGHVSVSETEEYAKTADLKRVISA